jgi:dTDP-4-dehydrorhamnose 3,5-epimerase
LHSSDPDFGKFISFVGNGSKKTSFIVPEYCGFGYQILHNADILYALDQPWSPDYDIGIIYNDPEINTPWPNFADAILSSKDQNLMTFNDFKNQIGSL